MVISTIAFFIFTFILFFIYFLKKISTPLLVAIILVTIFSWICVAPDGALFIEIGNSLSELFSFVNKALF